MSLQSLPKIIQDEVKTWAPTEQDKVVAKWLEKDMETVVWPPPLKDNNREWPEPICAQHPHDFQECSIKERLRTAIQDWEKNEMPEEDAIWNLWCAKHGTPKRALTLTRAQKDKLILNEIWQRKDDDDPKKKELDARMTGENKNDEWWSGNDEPDYFQMNEDY